MTKEIFFKFADRKQCPSCMGTNLEILTNSNLSGWLSKGVYFCHDCKGIPCLCNVKGVIYMKYNFKNIVDCNACGEENADGRTHAILY